MIDHVEERRKFISDAFHTLNQPLTGLHCGLEIAVQKPRTEGEYRKRIGDGIANAGEILKLVRAVRQLVEASDPGERFGTVNLAIVLSQLRNELEVVAEATKVGLVIECPESVQVKADPGKLMAALGGLIAEEMETAKTGVLVAVSLKKKMVVLTVTTSRRVSQDVDGKMEEIRRNAAVSYLWAIGAECERGSDRLVVTIPLAV